ncbi:hypothetical protein [Bacillus cereus]|uniref:hypothetical protein n=1 Tax=Bacillus cereus TaxID=1396 RepID=UPI001E2DC602|nr:hypothetical protein [Bacillus cereus]
MRTDDSSYAVLRIEYFDGHSPIGVDGIEISSLEDKSLLDLIPWLQFIQAKVLSSHEIEPLISSKKTTFSILQIHLTLDE